MTLNASNSDLAHMTGRMVMSRKTTSSRAGRVAPPQRSQGTRHSPAWLIRPLVTVSVGGRVVAGHEARVGHGDVGVMLDIRRSIGAVGVLHDGSLQKPGVDIVHREFHTAAPGFDALETRLHILEAGFVVDGAVLEEIQALVHLVEELLHAHEALGHIVREAVNLIGEAAH